MYFKKIRSGIAAIVVLGICLAACNNQNGDRVAVDTSILDPSDTMQTLVLADTAQITTADTSATSTTALTTVKTTKKLKASVEVVPAVAHTTFTKDAGGVYAYSEVMPSFPGGQSALDDYINNHINYPQQAIDDSKEGRVQIKFTVDENGKVTEVRNTGSVLGDGLDKEATRVVSGMPTWKPGTVKGKPVKVSMTLPIIFKIEE